MHLNFIQVAPSHRVVLATQPYHSEDWLTVLGEIIFKDDVEYIFPSDTREWGETIHSADIAEEMQGVLLPVLRHFSATPPQQPSDEEIRRDAPRT